VRRVALAATFVLSLALAGAAPGGGPGTWTRLSTGQGQNYFDVGLVRETDGTLHVVWPTQNGSTQDLRHTAIAPNGSVAGSSTPVATGWASGLEDATLRVDEKTGGLRVFFGGIRSTKPNEPNDALNTATAPADGGSWTLQLSRAAQSPDVYATTVGGGVAPDGTPITTWATTFGLRYHYGTDTSTPDILVPSGCCQYDPEIGQDSTTRQPYLAWFSNETSAQGIYVQAISPTAPTGARFYAPGSATADRKAAVSPLHRIAIEGRAGNAGVYVAYGAGYPTIETVDVWRVGTDAPAITIGAQGAENVMLAAAPEGRYWVFWSRRSRAWAARTGRDVTRIGPVSSVAGPAGTSEIWKLGGNGTLGRLDLVANLTTTAGTGFWHTQVLPRLALSAHASAAKRKVVFVVTDPDGVKGAKITVAGRTVTANASGTAVLPLGVLKKRHRYTAVATMAGYTAARASFKTP
jgi:hypothetical protein